MLFDGEKTNPIQSQSKPILDKMTVLDAEGLRLPQSRRSFAMTLVGYLKKQSQFAGGANRRKVLNKRNLWQ